MPTRFATRIPGSQLQTWPDIHRTQRRALHLQRSSSSWSYSHVMGIGWFSNETSCETSHQRHMTKMKYSCKHYRYLTEARCIGASSTVHHFSRCLPVFARRCIIIHIVHRASSSSTRTITHQVTAAPLSIKPDFTETQ